MKLEKKSNEHDINAKVLQNAFNKLTEAQANGADIAKELGDFGEADFSRPWGGYIVLADAPTFKAKILLINPGKRLSLQSHKNRSEVWVVVEGSVKATVNNSEKIYNYGETIQIPKESKHRLENPTDKIARVAEIQVGSSFEENDIVRYEDDHGRAGS